MSNLPHRQLFRSTQWRYATSALMEIPRPFPRFADTPEPFGLKPKRIAVLSGEQGREMVDLAKVEHGSKLCLRDAW